MTVARRPGGGEEGDQKVAVSPAAAEEVSVDVQGVGRCEAVTSIQRRPAAKKNLTGSLSM